MNGRESIILVPGLFGFAQIGEIGYFAEVAKLLSRATQVKIADIVALETPPTGPLWRRVDTLHTAVRERLPGGIGKVHLVGHSTGGVDVRLLTNSRYLWPHGPAGLDRSSWFDSIGAVISISAPQQGTPLASRLRGSLEGTIPFLFLVSLLAKWGERPRGVWKGTVARLEKAQLFWQLVAGLTSNSPIRSPRPPSAAPTSNTDQEIRDFLEEIVEDHPLIHELTGYAMARLNQKLQVDPAVGDRALAVSSFVTAAPPPALQKSDLRLNNGLRPALRAFYAASYAVAQLEPNEFGPFPTGPWIGAAPAGLSHFSAVAQDGVVPAASQTLDGTAVALVYGDHLDVVGHYPGAQHGGETVFDSGADFDDSRMEALWTAVGREIVNARRARPEP